MTTKQQLLQQWNMLNIDDAILRAFELVPRENFIAAELLGHAYDDHPLPTMRKQSISQPSTIVMMLQALELKPGEKVLEIGAGVGYQAAIISQIIGRQGKLITFDVIPELIHLARNNLQQLGITNTSVVEADGSEGCPEEAPFDKIIITAACPTIPKPIIEQLKEGGIVVAPVGDLESQTMVKGVKEQGKLQLEFLGSFRFVPLKGKHGFKEVEMYYG